MPSIATIVTFWFACSLFTEITDSVVMRWLKAPLTLCLWKFVVSVPCGFVAIHMSGHEMPSLAAYVQPAVLKRVTPLALIIVAAKLLTYISYGHVPLSTAQVAKAATPVAAVLLTRITLGERFGLQSYVSLVPIVVGVCLGVGVGLDDFNMLGSVAAAASCVFAAGQAIYMKTIYLAEARDLPALPPLTLNLVVASICVALLLPLWLSVQGGALPAALDGGRRVLARGHAHHLLEGRLPLTLLLGALTQYVQSACAYLFLERVSPATSAVVGTARKPFIVVSSVAVFATPITLLHAHGIVLTFGGVCWYNYARYVEARDAAGHVRVATSDDELEGAEDAAHPSDSAPRPPKPSSTCMSDFGMWYEAQLARTPLLVKVATSALLYGLGDLLGQTTAAVHEHALAARPFGSARWLRAAVYGGLFYAPLAHGHYNLLEHLVVVRWQLRGVLVPWVKMGLEQFVYWSYLSNAYYHVVIGMLQGLRPLDALAALSRHFWPTMFAQWALWVPVQLLNFAYVPVRHQLGLVLMVSLLWTTFLSAAFPPTASPVASPAPPASPPHPRPANGARPPSRVLKNHPELAALRVQRVPASPTPNVRWSTAGSAVESSAVYHATDADKAHHGPHGAHRARELRAKPGPAARSRRLVRAAAARREVR